MNFLRHLPAVILAAIALGPAARAQVVTPVPAPTIITTAPYTISKPGYYQLGADLVVSNTTGNIITINAGNVTLDFGGHYISGPANTPGSTVYGVYAVEEGNLIIRNGTIAYCQYGIYVDGNGNTSSLNINQRIDNMLVSYCYSGGILYILARNSEVTNCRVSSIGGSSVSNTTSIGIDGYGTGINIVNNTITTITASAATAYGIFTNGTGVNVLNNTITAVSTSESGGTAYGIYQASYAANNVIDNVSGSFAGYGLYNVGFAVGNTINTATYGIYYGGSTAGKYMGNLTLNCSTGFTGGTAVGSNN